MAALQAISTQCLSKSILVLVDSETAEGAQTRGASGGRDLTLLFSRFGHIAVVCDL